ncbi:hypothetical protein [Azospirillum picis]|uniref:Transposase n=1 Tax=Azospirillum picis TaxID=488438 RepID=A0ABU0MRE2_9PROT|nr:hypothetical protein [Azospirillum picis]MBP2302472.1 hypothetical protein [Azospirillum picis]MDQ0536051.1 hypothetical protein [Azospirillum picis]
MLVDGPAIAGITVLFAMGKACRYARGRPSLEVVFQTIAHGPMPES